MYVDIYFCPIPPNPKNTARPDPKDTAHRLVLARQRLHERATCSWKKTLLSARGTLQDLGLASQIDTKSNLLALIIIPSNGFQRIFQRNVPQQLLSSDCRVISKKQRCATPFRSLNDNCSAERPYRCAWRARSRRPNAYDTCERWRDAKASSEEAMVDVEVDRYIEDNSASNINHSPSFTETLSIKTEAPSIKYFVNTPAFFWDIYSFI